MNSESWQIKCVCAAPKKTRGNRCVCVLLRGYISSCYCSWKQNLPLKRCHKTVSLCFIASALRLTSHVFDFRGESRHAFCLIQCYLTLLYERIKLMVSDQPREDAHKIETNWEIIGLVNWSKSSITHSILHCTS